MFRVGTTVELEFDEEQLAKAREWFLTTIESIYQDTEFKDKIEIEYASKNKSLDDYGCNDFFCNYLCDSRTRCPRSMFYDIDGGKNNEED